MGPTTSSKPADPNRAPRVWRLGDGKTGHERQSQGLADALRVLTDATVIDLPAPSLGAVLLRGSRGAFGAAAGSPPDIVLGAGHATHWGLVAARRGFGAFSVVLMRPSLPWSLFDLCLVPRHDLPPARANVVVTHGVLNTVLPAHSARTEQGLVLIGGPSRHHDWDEAGLLRQLRALLGASPAVSWTLGDSRRTPASTRVALAGLAGPSVRYEAVETTHPGWVTGELARCGVVWVTEDSVSMVYEALTAGAATGILRVPRQPASRVDRVSQAIDALIASGEATAFERWEASGRLRRPTRPLAEANRCAEIVLARWRASLRRAPRAGADG